MFTAILSIIGIILLLILAVYALFDLHDSVVILKEYAPEAELSPTAQFAYTFVQRFKN